ncbi:MAG TPA: DedA family protein [Blastocatellia bacterium]|nr:DedA family protein [Blastocatellia bacterium]
MLSFLISYFKQYGYWVVLLGVMLENAGLPVPGETVLLAAGFFASQGHFQLLLVMLVAAVGAVLGDNAGYYIGRRVGRAALARWGRYGGLTTRRLERFDKFFHQHGDKTILVARFITGLRVFAALLAGAAHMPWRTFALYNMLGAILWSVAISLAGFFFGHSWNLLEQWVGRAGLIALALVVAGLVIAFVIKRRRAAAAEA